jgi:predicted protein tyrosine phosphatase
VHVPGCAADRADRHASESCSTGALGAFLLLQSVAAAPMLQGSLSVARFPSVDIPEPEPEQPGAGVLNELDVFGRPTEVQSRGSFIGSPLRGPTPETPLTFRRTYYDDVEEGEVEEVWDDLGDVDEAVGSSPCGPVRYPMSPLRSPPQSAGDLGRDLYASQTLSEVSEIEEDLEEGGEDEHYTARGNGRSGAAVKQPVAIRPMRLSPDFFTTFGTANQRANSSRSSHSGSSSGRLVSPATPGMRDDQPQCVAPGLYLGALEAACNPKALRRHNIAHVLTLGCGMALNPKIEAMLASHHTVEIEDKASEKAQLAAQLGACIGYIEGCRATGRGVLVHCLAGRSRSASIVAAYLMQCNKCGLEEAMAQIKAVRPWVCPNEGFLKILRDFQDSPTAKLPVQQGGEGGAVAVASRDDWGLPPPSSAGASSSSTQDVCAVAAYRGHSRSSPMGSEGGRRFGPASPKVKVVRAESPEPFAQEEDDDSAPHDASAPRLLPRSHSVPTRGASFSVARRTSENGGGGGGGGGVQGVDGGAAAPPVVTMTSAAAGAEVAPMLSSSSPSLSVPGSTTQHRGGSVGAAHEAAGGRRGQLERLSVRELKRIARAHGVDDETVEALDEADDIKGAAIELVLGQVVLSSSPAAASSS